jgi:eukaryotic-like serine/threonine-protein kinase
MANIELSDRTNYCPVCTCCMQQDPAECPECLSPRPSDGWEDVATSSYPYLGKQLDGRYIVDRFLGAGTTGDVYRGVGRRIQRPFALKIVDVQRYGNKDIEEEMLHRLEVEVDAMGRLRNPHVINVYESFQIRDHVFVLVMDYVEGVTLQERLERTGRLELDEAFEIIRQVANGLHEAHQRGIIHRDLKPENIMIEQMPASGIFARILDFGIAYMVDGARRTAGFRGTPLYASPEQCVSDGTIDARSDVYSLGCVLFHCLTGQPPYRSERSLAVMEAHIEAEIPSVFDVLDATAVPRRVDELVRRLLAKEPDARPADCGEVVKLLDDIDLSKDSREFDPSDLDSAESSLVEGTSPHLGDSESELQRRQRVVHMVASLQLPERIDTAPGNVTASALGPGGDYAVLADRDNMVHLVGLKTHLRTMTFGGAEEMITAVVIDSNRGDVYAAGFDSRVIRWNLNLTTGLPRRVVDVADRILALDVDQKGARLALGTERGRTLLYDLRTERLTELYQAPSPVSTVRFVAQTGRLFIGCWAGELKTLDLDGGRELAELAPLETPPRSAAVGADGELGAVVDEAGKLRILNLMDASAYLEIEASIANLRALSFSRDGKLNGLGISGEDLQLWLVRNENVLQHLSHRDSTAVSSS